MTIECKCRCGHCLTGEVVIHFCPLHDAAEDMLAALTELVEAFRGLRTPPLDSYGTDAKRFNLAWAQALESVAKAKATRP